MSRILTNDDKRSLIICFYILLGLCLFIGFIYLLVQFNPEDTIEDIYQDCIFRCSTDGRGKYTNLECPVMCRELLGCSFDTDDSPLTKEGGK